MQIAITYKCPSDAKRTERRERTHTQPIQDKRGPIALPQDDLGAGKRAT